MLLVTFKDTKSLMYFACRYLQDAVVGVMYEGISSGRKHETRFIFMYTLEVLI